MSLQQRKAVPSPTGTTPSFPRNSSPWVSSSSSSPSWSTSSSLRRLSWPVFPKPRPPQRTIRCLLRIGALFSVLLLALLVGNLVKTLGVGQEASTVPTNKEQLKQTAPFSSSSSTTSPCPSYPRTLPQLQACYPTAFEKSVWIKEKKEECSSITTWDDVQRCLVGSRNPTNSTSPLTSTNQDQDSDIQIHIIGERHCGTKFLTTSLQQCFPRERTTVGNNRRVRVHRDFLRGKHWFQPIIAGATASPVATGLSQSIVVAIVRNATDWVAAMHEAPYHAPNHCRFLHSSSANDGKTPIQSLPWQEFVSKPWTLTLEQEKMVRPDYDWSVLREWNDNGNLSAVTTARCQDSFPFTQIVPCRNHAFSTRTKSLVPPSRWRGFAPIYELQPTPSQHQQKRFNTLQMNPPYDHVLQLRTDKIWNFVLQVPILLNIKGFVVVRYEDLLQFGTRDLLQTVSNILGLPNLPPHCKVTPPQPERFISKRHIPDDFREWIETHVDVATERFLGYRI